ncbi:hypothetical protein GCM10017710_14050 [Arthrobacter ramosus]
MKSGQGMMLALSAMLGLSACEGSNTSPPTEASPKTLTLASNLDCPDAFSADADHEPEPPAPDTPRALGVSARSWSGSPPGYGWPIKDNLSGFAVTIAGIQYGGWKAPLTLEPGIGERVVSIEGPDDAALMVVSSKDWGTNPSLREGDVVLHRSYSVKGCQSRRTEFPGMILVRGPACVVIRVSDPVAGATSNVSVPMYGGACK